MSKDIEHQRELTKKRVEKFRAKKRLENGVCSQCGGKGYIELEAGLIRRRCRKCS